MVIQMNHAFKLGIPEDDLRQVLLGGLPTGSTCPDRSEWAAKRSRIREIVVATRIIMSKKGDRQACVLACPSLSLRELFALCSFVGVISMGNFMNKFADPEMDVICAIALEKFKKSHSGSVEAIKRLGYERVNGA